MADNLKNDEQIWYSAGRHQSWRCFKCGGDLWDVKAGEWIGGRPRAIDHWVPEAYLSDGESVNDISNIILLHKDTCKGKEAAPSFQYTVFPEFHILRCVRKSIEIGNEARRLLDLRGCDYPFPGCFAVYVIYWENATVLGFLPDGRMAAAEFLGKKNRPGRFPFRPLPNPNKNLYGLESDFPTFRQGENYIGQVEAWRLFDRWKEHRSESSNPGVRTRMELSARVVVPPFPAPPRFQVVRYFPSEKLAKQCVKLVIKGKRDVKRNLNALRNRLNIQEKHNLD